MKVRDQAEDSKPKEMFIIALTICAGAARIEKLKRRKNSRRSLKRLHPLHNINATYRPKASRVG